MISTVEPWLRATHTNLDALRRQVIHALELTGEDWARWCSGLTAKELNSRPFGLPSVAFQGLHIARSLDRLLTYAEGHLLSDRQREALSTEADPVTCEEVFREVEAALASSRKRVLATSPAAYEETRYVGRDRLPTTLGGLLIHCAEHTQRHTGQMITTAKLVLSLREQTESAG